MALLSSTVTPDMSRPFLQSTGTAVVLFSLIIVLNIVRLSNGRNAKCSVQLIHTLTLLLESHPSVKFGDLLF